MEWRVIGSLAAVVGIWSAAPPVSRALDSVSDPSLYPVFMAQEVQEGVPTGGGGASGIPIGWQGIDVSQLPADLTETNFFQRWWKDFSAHAYPEGYVRDDLVLNAWQQIEDLKIGLGGEAASAAWTNIGPAPEVGEYQGGASGRPTDIAVRPGNPNEWLVATGGGGIWKTTDGGDDWVPTTDDQPTLAIGAVAYAPSNPAIAYAGTGDFVGLPGLGLLKSTDGGDTWTFSESVFMGQRFHDLRVHPADPNTVIAATSHGIFRTTDGGNTWARAPIPGLLLGSPVADVGTAVVTDLETDPTNFSRQYAGLPDRGGFQLGVLRSADGGQSWSMIDGPWAGLASRGRVELAIYPANPNVLYVGVEAPSSGDPFVRLWRTNNAWSLSPAWQEILQAGMTDHEGESEPHGYCGAQCGYDNELIVDPNDPDILYAAAVRLWKYDGTTWKDLTRGREFTGIHADQHTMAWAGGELIVGNDGGVWSTTDGGSTWTSQNAKLSTLLFYHGSLHPTNQASAMGGAQDNGTAFAPPSGTYPADWIPWERIGGGDGADNFFASSQYDPDMNFAYSNQYLGMVREEDNGSCNVGESLPPSPRPFIGTVAKCPANDDIVIAGLDQPFETTEFFSNPCLGGQRPLWTASCGSDGSLSAQILALDFAPSDGTCSSYAFAAQFGGEVRLTTDGGSTCRDLNAAYGIPPDVGVSDLAFDPTDANVVYLTGTGTNGGGVFKTENALEPDEQSVVWKDITPLDRSVTPITTSFETVAVDPTQPNVIYAGSDLGLFRSVNGGKSWVHIGMERDLPFVEIKDVQFQGLSHRVVAFTHGRSAFDCGPGDVDNDGFPDGCDNCPALYNASQQLCSSDCNEDCETTIDEIITGVNIGLGIYGLDHCVAADQDGDGQVTVRDIVTGVNGALSDDSCGFPSGGNLIAMTTNLAIGNPQGVRGTTVTVDVAINGAANVATGAQLDILFDPAVLTIADPSSNCALGTALNPQDHMLGASLPASPAPPSGRDRLRILVVPTLSHSPLLPLSDGTIASCTFQILGDAPLGPSALTAELAEVVDASGNVVQFVTTADGEVMVCDGCGCS